MLEASVWDSSVFSASVRRRGRVSVVVVTYQQADFVRETVTSVLEQDYEDLEIVVADDGSTDGTREIIGTLTARDTRVIPAFPARHLGFAGNVNQGLARTTGEYVAFLGGDDVMLPGKLARQAAFMRDHPECSLSTHDMDVFDSVTGSVLYRWSERFAMRGGGPEAMFAVNWLLGRPLKFLPSAHMFRADAAPCGGYDGRLRFACDWLFDIELLTRGRLGYLPEVLGRYRRHARQMSQSRIARDTFYEEMMMALGIIAVRYPQLAALVRRKRTFTLFQALVFDWVPMATRVATEAQLRIEAGTVIWLYMKTVRFMLHHRRWLEATRPARRLVKRFLGEI